ncbi:MAG: HYExAFE family protein [Patescibacteria group bacterium]|nr:HYExAFE family protein [Patescibacteria group bacterium]
MKRDNHYEVAFEAFLRSRRVPYVAVDEAKRSVLSNGGSIKSLDFIVSSPSKITWLVDVKGRRFPSGEIGKQYWKNWSTRDDLVSLAQWEELFGDSFRALFVFAYDVLTNRAPLPEAQLFRYRDGLYGFVGVRLRDYAAAARIISPRWDTVAMPTAEFRRIARPIDAWLAMAGEAANEPPAVEQDERKELHP